MDNYPTEFDPISTGINGGTIPFEEWWEHAQHAFRNVPANVAEQWIHRHWNESRFGSLTSSRYAFILTRWDSDRLIEVLSIADDWQPDRTLRCGKGLFELDHFVVNYMRKHRDFPVPIIALDNTSGYLNTDPNLSPFLRDAPRATLLVEGHTRHALACWMIKLGDFASTFNIWMLENPNENALTVK